MMRSRNRATEKTLGVSIAQQVLFRNLITNRDSRICNWFW